MIDLSKAGQLFIAAFEGFSAICYDDGGRPGVGNATIGYGHLIHFGPTTAADRLKWGTITHSTGLQFLHKDAAGVINEIRRQIKVRLTPAQVDALVSLGYNCGTGAIQSIAPIVNQKPHRWNLVKMRSWRYAVTAQFLRWDHVNGKVWPGLLRRRQAESFLFRTGKYTRAQSNTSANS